MTVALDQALMIGMGHGRRVGDRLIRAAAGWSCRRKPGSFAASAHLSSEGASLRKVFQSSAKESANATRPNATESRASLAATATRPTAKSSSSASPRDSSPPTSRSALSAGAPHPGLDSSQRAVSYLPTSAGPPARVARIPVPRRMPASLMSRPEAGVEQVASPITNAVPVPEVADAPTAAPSSMPFLQPNYMEFAPRITVVGCGGAGGNAVSNMIARKLKGVEFLVCNTDAQHLSTTLTDNRLQLGRNVTEGLGCGANPDAGRQVPTKLSVAQAALESKDEILEMIEGSHMVFITAGMGGGTGTGAAPVIAETCMEAGILTVAVVTKPFRFEGTHRMRLAEEGLGLLRNTVDTLIVIPNQNLFSLVDKQTSLLDSFRLADDVLLAGVRSVTDLMVNPGLINLDFADVQAVMAGMGNAMMGTGEGEGEGRALRAAEDALCNPLLGELSIKSAKGVLVSITGGADMTLFEVDEAARRVTEEVEDEAANIIFGSTYDSALEGAVRVSVVATGG